MNLFYENYGYGNFLLQRVQWDTFYENPFQRDT